MPNDKNKIDLLNGPVELARKMSQEQMQAFRGQFVAAPVNPYAEVLKRHGLSLKGLRDARTK